MNTLGAKVKKLKLIRNILLIVAGAMVVFDFIMNTFMLNQMFKFGPIFFFIPFFGFAAAMYLMIRNQSLFKNERYLKKINREDILSEITTDDPTMTSNFRLWTFHLYISRNGFYLNSPGNILPYSEIKSMHALPYIRKSGAMFAGAAALNEMKTGMPELDKDCYVGIITKDGTSFSTLPMHADSAQTFVSLIRSYNPDIEWGLNK